MFRMRVITPLLAIGLVAGGLAACGSSNDHKDTSQTVRSESSSTISVANSRLGNILVDSKGRTIYLFAKDSGTRSACFGDCAVDWPPVRDSGTPTVGSSLSASKVGTIPRSDGKPQVTYNGHPLYLFQNDNKPGDTNGQGLNAFGAGWFVLSPAGQEIQGNGSSGNGY
jgi:predicted lipoprotein with Yx(FWY)xxD motif